jgi:hypothetical protein
MGTYFVALINICGLDRIHAIVKGKEAEALSQLEEQGITVLNIEQSPASVEKAGAQGDLTGGARTMRRGPPGIFLPVRHRREAAGSHSRCCPRIRR